jgi:O-antigen/teichoic acid export membrane protein
VADTAEHDLSTSDLARSAASGVRWTSLAGAVAAGLNLLQTLVVARLLNPSDFGLMASAMVVVALAGAFADAGLASAIVARKTSPESLSSLYWTNLLVGGVICALLMGAAPLVAGFYNQPRLEGIVRTAALLFVIGPIGQQFGWLLERELRFRPLGVVQIAAAVVGTVAAIAAAIGGAGVYALLVGMLVTVTMTALLLVCLGWRRWRPMLRLRWRDVRGYLDFGLYQMGERTVNYLASNTDYILIGRFLGPALLGTYSIAYQLVIKPLIYINPMLNRVAFPILATRQDDDAALARGYLHVVRLIAYGTVPLMLGLAIVAPEFIAVVLGPKWAASAPVLAILSGVGLLRSLTNPIGSVLLAKNRPDIGFKGNVVLLVAMAAVLFAVVQSGGGILAVAWASLAMTAVGGVAWLLVLRRLVGLRFDAYGRALRTPLALSALTASAMLVFHSLISRTAAGPQISLAAVALVGGAVYAVLLARYDAPYFRGLWRLFRSRAPA